MTEQKFRNRIKWRIQFSVALFIIGLVLAVISLWNYNSRMELLGSYNHCYLAFVLTFGAFITIVKNVRILKNKKLFTTHFLAETDERNVQIFRKAYAMSWLITVLSLVGAMFFVPSDMAYVLLAVLGITLVSYVASYWIFQKKD